MAEEAGGGVEDSAGVVHAEELVLVAAAELVEDLAVDADVSVRGGNLEDGGGLREVRDVVDDGRHVARLRHKKHIVDRVLVKRKTKIKQLKGQKDWLSYKSKT